MEDNDKRPREASLAAVGANYSSNHHPVSTSKQTLRLKDVRGHSTSNIKHILPEKSGSQNPLTNEKYSASRYGQQLKVATWPRQYSSRNTSECGSRVDEQTKSQDVKFRDNQHHLRPRHTSRGVDMTYIYHPNAHHFSPNTRQILPARYNWHYGMTMNEFNFYMIREQFRMRPWLMRDFSRYGYFEFYPRIHEYPKAQEIPSSVNQHEFLRRKVPIKGVGPPNPNAHQSLNTSQFLPERYRWQYGMMGDEYNLHMIRKYLGVSDWPMRGLSRNYYFDLGPRLHEYLKAQETPSSVNQHKFLRREVPVKGVDPTNPNAHQSSLNTSQFLPERYRWQYGMMGDECNLHMSRKYLGTRDRPMRDLSRNACFDFGSKIHEYPKVQEVKVSEDHKKVPQHSNRKSCRGNIQSNTDHSSNTGTIRKRNKWQHRMKEEYKLVENRRQLRMRTWTMKNASRNAESDLRQWMTEHPKGQEIKPRNNQHKYLCTGTESEENPIHTNPHHTLYTGQTFTAINGGENRTTDELMDEQQLGMNNRPVKDSNRNDESNFKSKEWENHPKEQEMKFGIDIRRRRNRNKGIGCLNDHSIDGMVRKSASAQNPNPRKCPAGNQLSGFTRMRDSKRDLESNISSEIRETSEKQLMGPRRLGYRCMLTRIIQYHCSLLYTKRAVSRTLLFRLICGLILFILIMLGIVLYFSS